MKIAVSKIRPNPEQPRKDFDEDSLASLAESIASVGLLNPIVIEGPYPDGFYNLIDGELRWTCILRERATLAVCKECPLLQFFKELGQAGS